MAGNRPLKVAFVVGAGLTLFVTLSPLAHFAYDNAALHLALETAEGMIAGLLAYLAVKRYRATGRLQDVILAWVFSVLAFVNLFLAAGPLVAEQARPGAWLTWVTLGLRLVAGAGLCAGALAGPRPVPPPRRLGFAVLGSTVAVFVTIGLAAFAANASLAEPVNALLSPRDESRPWAVGHPVVLAVQVLALVLYAGAAVGFHRQAREQEDDLLGWLAAGAVLGAFARFNYFLFPSLYSNFVYTGDLLRFGTYVFFLIGAAREIDRYWHDQTRLAAAEERQHLAHELHDGLAQELAFICSQTAAMASGMTYPGMVEHLSAAAQRALVESRRAVDALAGDAPEASGDESLPEALALAAREVATRAGATVEVEADGSPSVPGPVHDALLRVVREAANNAVRHGGATTVKLRLSPSGGGLHLTVGDNGTGFDPSGVPSGYGLRSMRERVEGLGGTLRVRSAPGQETVIEVDLPGERANRAPMR